MSLHLIESPPPAPQAFELTPIDLRRQPTRPGVTYSEIDFRVPIDLARTAVEIAADEGLQGSVWVGLVIESERIVGQACDGEHQAEKLRSYLDELARTPSPPVPGGAARLTEFGKALRGAARRPEQGPAVAQRIAEQPRLTARAPYQALTAWRRAAIGSGQRLDKWAAGRLLRLPRARFLWEASAAERGETLAEWVLVHATRR